MMTYEEALAFIHGTYRFGSKLGLENIRTLMELLGNPQDRLKFVHIAGTNGKGSTAAMICQMFIEAGYTTGLYTSPYLEKFNERIQINRTAIEDDALAEATEQVYDKIQVMLQRGLNHPTEFEVVTAMAFLYFEKMKCDVVILEVGMGGRLDATNVIKTPLVSIITPLDMDHTAYLGDTIEAIAFEKSGIIKPGVPVVAHPQVSSAEKIIKQICNERGCDLTIVDLARAEAVQSGFSGTDFTWDGAPYHLQFIASYQVQNAAVALTCAEVINAQSSELYLSSEAIREGLDRTLWSGRMEILRDAPILMVDGAHNLHGILGLREALKVLGKDRRIIGVMGVVADKDVSGMLEAILPTLDLVVVTEPDNPRALDAKLLAEKMETLEVSPIGIEKDIQKAVEKGLAVAEKEDIVLCFGSLYLVGRVRTLFRR